MRLISVISFFVAVGSSNVIPRGVHNGHGAAGTDYCPIAIDRTDKIVYNGVYQSGVEAFLGIRYGQDTGGQNRYKPPQPYSYASGEVVHAQSPGPACPQQLGDVAFPILLSNITSISEDCLLLDVRRPVGTNRHSKLPVMVFIHGGSFVISSKDEIISLPGGLILESTSNGYPIMHVAMNYRLASFGFAQSGALKSEGSENAGLRDQRLAIEWVKANIAAFGGDPTQITIFGQSSGLAVGMQIMAYGGTKPIPFRQSICESQCLEGGITGNFTRMAMERYVGAAGCNSTDLDSADTIACLRGKSTQQLLDAQTSTYLSTPAANLGDEWLPVVDGDFLPAAPSDLIAQGTFNDVTAIIGWTDDDADIIAPMTIVTAQDTHSFLRGYLPGFNDTSISTLEALYPVTEFSANPAANLTAEFYRSGRIMRDIVFTCMPMGYGQAMASKGNKVYYYDQNQTFLNPLYTAVGLPNLGVTHTSEFAYVFGNLSHYDVEGYPYKPNASDYALLTRESRSWSSFANFGTPSLSGKATLQGWDPAYARSGQTDIFVIGGPQEGLFAWSGGSNAALNQERLEERCGFLNSPSIIKQLLY